MNETLLWELIQKNAGHVEALNGEMAVVIERLAIVETKIGLIFYLVLGLALKAAWEVLGRFKEKINHK